MKTVLALDVSATACGWAFGQTADRPKGAVIRFAPKGAGADEVWAKAAIWMTNQLSALAPDEVAIEAPIMSSNPGNGGFTNPVTQGMLWGLQSALRTVVQLKMGRPAKLINVASARKFFTGRGVYPAGMAKPAIKQKCLALGWVDESATYDLCDALCVWAKAAADIDPTFAANFTPLGTRRAPAFADVEL